MDPVSRNNNYGIVFASRVGFSLASNADIFAKENEADECRAKSEKRRCLNLRSRVTDSFPDPGCIIQHVEIYPSPPGSTAVIPRIPVWENT